MKIREITDEDYRKIILDYGFELDDHVEDFENYYEQNLDKKDLTK